MKIQVFKTDALAARAAASVFSAEILMHNNPVIGLNAGGSANKIYAELVDMYDQGLLDFSAVKTFDVDELQNTTVIKDSIDSNFVSKVNLKPENTYRFNGFADDLDTECAQYEANIKKEGGIGVMMACFGDDGHVCYSEPAEQHINDTFVYTLEGPRLASTKAMFDKMGQPAPEHALSMGMGTMLRSRELVVVAFGAGKADVVKRITNGIIDPQCPASFFQMHPNATLFVDEAAAANL